MIGELIPTGATFDAGRVAINSAFSASTYFNGLSGTTFSGGTIYLDTYFDFNPQTSLPAARIGRLFFSGAPLNRLMQNTGGTPTTWAII